MEELKAIKGLFKKGYTCYNNGWARCTRDKVAKIEEKIFKAGFRFVEQKVKPGRYEDYRWKKYMNDAGDIAYLSLAYGMEEDWPGGSGKFTWGNVDLYRGCEYYNKTWEGYDK